MWSRVTVKTKHLATDKPVFSRLTKDESSRKIVERMQGHFPTAHAAKQAHNAGSPAWSAFEADIKDMQDRHADIGIEHARLEQVDFTDVERAVWDLEQEWER